MSYSQKVFFFTVFLFFPLSYQAEKFVPKSDLLHKIITKIEKKYVDPSRLNPEKMLKGALANISKNIAQVITEFKETKGKKVKVNIKVDIYEKEFIFKKLDSMSALEVALQKIMYFIKFHLEEDDKFEDVDYAVINGFLSKLDPHTNLLIPKIYSEFNTSTQGDFGGVGMMIGIRKGKLTVIAPIDDTPASRAGLKAQDVIVQIDDESTVNLSLSEAVGRLRGEKGEPVDLYILRDGYTEAKKHVIIRDIIKITSVDSSELKEGKKRLGYIKIKTFQQNTLDEINEALEKLNYNYSDFSGLILDMRNNPGGLLDQAIKVSNRFLKKGTIVSTSGIGNAMVRSFKAYPFQTISKLPIIILVNGGAASASEIVAAALKVNKRSIVLGTRTFGKGSVQQVFEMEDGSALKMTTSKFLTPGKISIQSIGITPDIEILPYFVSKKFVRIAENKTSRGEASLDNNFEEWGNYKEESLAKLYYLFEKEETETDDEEAVIKKESEQILKPEESLKKDYLVQFAKQILLKNEKKSYDSLLEASLNHLKIEKKKQEASLSKKLKEFQIEWDKPVKGKIAISTTFSKRFSKKMEVSIVKEVLDSTKDGQEVWKVTNQTSTADSKIRIWVKIKNKSSYIIPKVYAITSSKNANYDQRQLIFGTLKPNETKKWFFPITLPEEIIARNDSIDVKFFSDEGNEFHVKTFDLEISQKNRPYFSYSLKVFEDNSHESKGNNNGLIEVGETVSIEVNVKNKQKNSSSKNVVVLIKNGEHKSLFLKKGRQALKNFDASSSQKVYFTFDVMNIPEDNNFNLVVDIIDSTFAMNSISHEFKLPINIKKYLLRNHAPKLTLNKIPKATSKKTVTISGKLSDDKKVKDVYIFNKSKKVFYQRFKKSENKTVKFSTKLKLDENINSFLLISRDEQNVMTRKAIYVRKKK